jgi:hypothetical protein
MSAVYVVAAVALTVALLLLGVPSLIAAYRWWFGGGKLLNDRLGATKHPPGQRRPRLRRS